MSRLLYINASPRGELSASTQAAEVFLAALPGSVEVETINLFEADLPEVTLAVTAAKVKSLMALELTDDEDVLWQAVLSMVDTFKSADHYLMAIPMWNFGVPYKFKQYVDLITHPGLTFTRDENGPKGLASGSATIIFSRGGEYSPKDGVPDPFDHQSTYMNAWTTLVGIGPVNEILVQGTMAGPDAAANAVAGVKGRLQAAAESI